MADTRAPATLLVKAVPGASRTEIAGWLGDRLKVRVAAPPEGGKANQAIRELIAQKLGLRVQDIEITVGHSNPMKTLRIRGLDADAIARALAKP